MSFAQTLPVGIEPGSPLIGPQPAPKTRLQTPDLRRPSSPCQKSGSKFRLKTASGGEPAQVATDQLPLDARRRCEDLHRLP